MVSAFQVWVGLMAVMIVNMTYTLICTHWLDKKKVDKQKGG